MSDQQKRPHQPPKTLPESNSPANDANYHGPDNQDAANDPKLGEWPNSDEASQGLNNASGDRGDENEQPRSHVRGQRDSFEKLEGNQAQPSSGESKQVNIPPNLQTNEQALEAVRLQLDAPADMPDRVDAVKGLSLALKSLELEFPDVQYLIQAIEKVGVKDGTLVVAVRSVLGMSRRKGLHRIYTLAREIGHAHEAGKILEPLLLKIFGCHCIRSLLCGYQPNSVSIAKLRKSLLFESNQQTSWMPAARSRALIAAKRGVDADVKGNPLAAMGYGLLASVGKPEKKLSSVEFFNLAFRRRTENLVDFSTRDAVAAAGGYETLSAAGLLGIPVDRER